MEHDGAGKEIEEGFGKVTRKKLDKVLKYIPLLESDASKLCECHPEDSLLYPWQYAEEVDKFIEQLYKSGLIIVFDWGKWERGAEKYRNDHALMESADLLTLRKLLTTYVRADRFCDGMIAAVIIDGTLLAILKRLQVLRSSLKVERRRPAAQSGKRGGTISDHKTGPHVLKEKDKLPDIEKARALFREAGLAFPTIPEALASRLKERDKWCFSSRELEVWPYELDHYVREAETTELEDYVVLAHSGHGVNSYAIQYYLVHGAVEIFLHLGWGGVYMDNERKANKIRDCFSLADEIVAAAGKTAKLQGGERLMIVGSDFYGSYWMIKGKRKRRKDSGPKSPAKILAEALRWLKE